MKINSTTINTFLVLGACVLFFWLGRLTVLYEEQASAPLISTVGELNQKIPQVEILDIQNAKVVGTVNTPEIRLKSGDQLAVPEDDLTFSLDVQHLGYVGEKRPVVKKVLPEWARFVASKSGKYYYEIDEKSLKQLSVENQVYFATAEEAIKAGYQLRSK